MNLLKVANSALKEKNEEDEENEDEKNKEKENDKKEKIIKKAETQ